jgi:hypothetical protein
LLPALPARGRIVSSSLLPLCWEAEGMGTLRRRRVWVYVFGFPFQSANRIDESYYKGIRLRRDAAARASTGKSARGAQRKRGNKKGTTKRPSLGGCVPHAGREMRGSRLGYEVTSQTQAVQSTAVMSLVFRSSLPTDRRRWSEPHATAERRRGGRNEKRKERKAHYTSAVVRRTR